MLWQTLAYKHGRNSASNRESLCYGALARGREKGGEAVK